MAREYHQGKFVPRHPEKYAGDKTNIHFRSSWERKVMNWLDLSSQVLAWNSEEVIVPYYSPVDRKWHRYFVDFAAKIQTNSGKIEKVLIEVKPFAQTQLPKVPKRKTQRYINEVTTYITNQEKWKAAEAWVQKNGFDKFMILTEKEIKV